MELYGNPKLTGNERYFDKDDIIVTKTDLTGKITYGNRTFTNISGFKNEQECLGVQHNIIRHPQMPRSVFELLWETIKNGDEIFAYVINRALNGDHYWVFAHVTPSFDNGGNIINYHSNRRVPNKDIINTHIKPLYSILMEIEKKDSSQKQGLANAMQKLSDVLKTENKTYSEFIFSLGV